MLASRTKPVHHMAIIALIATSAGTQMSLAASESMIALTAEACTSCHGPAGHSLGEMPTIGGMPQDNLVDALQGFRDGSRSGTIMNRLVGPLTDEDIAMIAAYFAGLREADQ